ncbi:MAG: cysteine--1-D-myo-inosityl 2-amino-2-deoxy-alpha-D-glucopyranoside ligase [Actinobacteria bacterium]|nr:MAG: cysteine--1-D-myo-inosityl 2-amino-2-deoxy-alpha-D-glucopyranoside ligase [Actinomycetota bacterium]
MQTWPSPSIPALPGRAPGLTLFDTATGELRPSSPGEPARLYVCGITPYDSTHLGHAATYTAFDLVQRMWIDAGHEVLYVQNITDVDDPLLERAAATGEDWEALAAREIARFVDDMTELRLLAPDEWVSVVESIPHVVRAIEKLLATGAAYEVDGDLYFDITADPRFGSVANLSAADMLRLSAERGGDPDRAGKRHPLDALLWRAERPGEPSWPSPFGPGRPGWHVECVAIALDDLGPAFDVQGGGRDLAFPHHEIGASQGQVISGEWPYARIYCHAGLVGYQGQKMSKSLGNLVFVSDLRAQHDAMAVRLVLLDHHYREDWEYRDGDLAAAELRLARWREAVAWPTGPPAERLLEQVRERMADDLDAPAALRLVDRWAEEQRVRGGDDPSAPGIVSRMCDALLGVAL